MDFFDRQWSTYRAVVDHDLMQHRALTAALGPVTYPCQWREQDLLTWTEAEPGPEPVDLLHSAFAIHHLSPFDFPSDRDAIRHIAEALAVLRPA